MKHDMCVKELADIADLMVEKYGAGEFIYACSLVIASLARAQSAPGLAIEQFRAILEKHFRVMDRKNAS